MSKLLSAVGQILSHRSTSAIQEYRQILQRRDSPGPRDAERLAELMPTLGISAQDVAKDVADLASEAELQAAMMRPDTLRANEEKAVNARRDATEKYRALLQQIIGELEPTTFDGAFDLLLFHCGAIKSPRAESIQRLRNRVIEDVAAIETAVSVERNQQRQNRSHLDELHSQNPRLFARDEASPASEPSAR